MREVGSISMHPSLSVGNRLLGKTHTFPLSYSPEQHRKAAFLRLQVRASTHFTPSSAGHRRASVVLPPGKRMVLDLELVLGVWPGGWSPLEETSRHPKQKCNLRLDLFG